MEKNRDIPPLKLHEIGLLPDFCDVRIVFMVVLVTELLALVLSLATPARSINFWDHLALTSMLMQWTALLNAALFCGLRRRLNRLRLWPAMGLSLCLMMLVSASVALALLSLNEMLALDTDSSPLGPEFFLRIMVISLVIYALLLRYFYIQYQWRSQLAAQTRAEIQALQARIRPHFLFNSMNTIASLVPFNPEAAEKAIVDLSELFRASLMQKDTHSLGDEIAITQSYLDIEKLRLGERLATDWEVEKSLLDEEIPALCLQPLVENAIYHGVEPLTAGGRISISAGSEGEHLVLRVSNPLDNSSTMPHKTGNRMAQQNIRQRLELAYGKRAGFLTNETKHSYSVILSIPLERVL